MYFLHSNQAVNMKHETWHWTRIWPDPGQGDVGVKYVIIQIISRQNLREAKIRPGLAAAGQQRQNQQVSQIFGFEIVAKLCLQTICINKWHSYGEFSAKESIRKVGIEI